MNEPTLRVNYFPRQFVRTQDLAAEQRYHLALHRRHESAHHTWGIVRGLELMVDEEGAFILPGLGVDGFGRELVLTDRIEIPKRAFDQRNTDELEIWLTYDRLGSDPAPPGYAACDTDPAQVPRYRWLERPQVRYTVPDPAFGDRRRPRGLTEAELAFDATQTAPDDPDQEWLLFLGLVRRTPNEQRPYSIDLTGRPYAGLIGESIIAPSRQAWLQVGVDPAEIRDPSVALLPGDDAPRRFAVLLPPAPGTDVVRVPLSVDSAGETDLRGVLTVDGSVHVERGTLAFDGWIDPPSARPWSIYRAKIDDGSAAATGDELRIEMASTSNGLNRVAVGAWSKEAKAFMPCLTIADDCTVTVYGDLIVEGRIIRDGVPLAEGADDRLDAQARIVQLAAFQSGMSSAADFVAGVFDASADDVVVQQLAMVMASPGAVEVATEAVAAVDLSALASSLWDRDPDIVAGLIAALEAAIPN